MQQVAELPVGIITTDACIIEEQPEHLIVAVRLAKSVIVENHALLAAISERSGPQSPRNARAAILRDFGGKGRKKAKYLASAALCGIALVAGAFLAIPGALVADTKPPMRTWGVTMLSPLISVGTPNLELAFWGHRTRLCKTDVERVFWRGEQPVYRVRMQGSGQALTPEPIYRIHKIPLPNGLTAGHYKFQSISYADCGPGDQHATSTPILEFEVQ